MDGVVTDTARAHAAAWKRLFDAYLSDRAQAGGAAFRPFDANQDYRRYVDGKPRYDGVASFLTARNIALPRGAPDDPPEAETVCGLGNRKDKFFRTWLTDHAVRAFPGTLRLIAALRRAGVAVAVFSASRNAEAVLRSAGVIDLFAARVDGEVLAKLGLPGKPDPAMLAETAARVGVLPARAAVVEDALAGVEAGRRGGFACVVGVDRDHAAEALRRAGADLVVSDLAELDLTPAGGLAVRRLAALPAIGVGDGGRQEARAHQLAALLAGRSPAVLLGCDRLLSAPADDGPALPGALADALRQLVRCCPVALVGSQAAGRLGARIALEGVFCLGSDGLADGPPGSAIHGLPPDVSDRGEAVLWLLDRIAPGGTAALPIHVGADPADEAVFRALAGRGLCVALRGIVDRPTAADLALDNVADVAPFLELVAAAACGRETTEHRPR